MATISNSETVYKEVRDTITRYRFRYALDNGEVHERIAWVASTVDEATERTARGAAMLTELAEAEATQVIS